LGPRGLGSDGALKSDEVLESDGSLGSDEALESDGALKSDEVLDSDGALKSGEVLESDGGLGSDKGLGLDGNLVLSGRENMTSIACFCDMLAWGLPSPSPEGMAFSAGCSSLDSDSDCSSLEPRFRRSRGMNMMSEWVTRGIGVVETRLGRVKRKQTKVCGQTKEVQNLCATKRVRW
jgi:hypothetical protein